MVSHSFIPSLINSSDYEDRFTSIRHLQFDEKLSRHNQTIVDVVDFYFLYALEIEKDTTRTYYPVSFYFRRSPRKFLLLRPSQLEMYRCLKEVQKRLQGIRSRSAIVVDMARDDLANKFIELYRKFDRGEATVFEVWHSYRELYTEHRQAVNAAIYLSRFDDGFLKPTAAINRLLRDRRRFLDPIELLDKVGVDDFERDEDVYRSSLADLQKVRPRRVGSNITDAEVYAICGHVNASPKWRNNDIFFRNITDGINAQVLWQRRYPIALLPFSDRSTYSYCRDLMSVVLEILVTDSKSNPVPAWREFRNKLRELIKTQALLKGPTHPEKSRLLYKASRLKRWVRANCEQAIVDAVGLEGNFGAVAQTGEADLDDTDYRLDLAESNQLWDIGRLGRFLEYIEDSEIDKQIKVVEKKFRSIFDDLVEILEKMAGGKASWRSAWEDFEESLRKMTGDSGRLEPLLDKLQKFKQDAKTNRLAEGERESFAEHLTSELSSLSKGERELAFESVRESMTELGSEFRYEEAAILRDALAVFK